MQHIIDAVEKNRQLILDSERYVWQHPETGFKEFTTNEYMKKIFISLGYDLVCPDDITGFYTVIDTGREGPEVMILAELDSIICPAHPDANKNTGAVHSCGHNAQCAAMAGIAAALKDQSVLDKLCGKIRLCLVPAEELLEIEYRSQLRAEGKIKYFGGKNEFLRRGYFDGVDMAFMVHTAENYTVTKGCVGCLTKNIIYKGKAAHAGSTPWDGNNALYAANCGLNAINAIRETFKEADIIRVHPIITSGGDMVNAIPETVRLESFVRGNSSDAIVNANKKVNQALIGAALSINTNIEIIDTPGYAPLKNDYNMCLLAKEAADLAIPHQNCTLTDHTSSGSTDMGDLCCIMPVVHPYAGGATGNAHGNDFYISDPVSACVDCAKWQLAMLELLLKDSAVRAKQILSDFKPQFDSKEAYLSFIDSLNCSGDRIVYDGENTTIKL